MVPVKGKEVFMFSSGPPVPGPDRERAAMIPGNYGHYRGLISGEARHLGVLDQVERMPMVIVVSNVIADVMQQCGVLQQRRLRVAHSMDRPHLVENPQ